MTCYSGWEALIIFAPFILGAIVLAFMFGSSRGYNKAASRPRQTAKVYLKTMPGFTDANPWAIPDDAVMGVDKLGHFALTERPDLVRQVRATAEVARGK